jgi:SPP1 gp7 family putative phage head morphogenesis protein
MAEESNADKAAKEPRANASDNLLAEQYIGAAEESYYKSPMVPDSYQTPYNSDDLYKKTGDYSIYEDMLDDDQVSICLDVKKDLVLGSGYEFISEDESQEDMIDELFEENYHCSFNDSVKEILSGYEFGFSLTEKLFDIKDDGKLALKDLKTRHPNSWLIHQDDKGNVTKYEQNTVKGFQEINPKALIHYVNNRKFQNPYGRSDLRSCYNAWFAKRQAIRFYAIFLEKAASPIPVGRFDKNAPASAIDKLFNILKTFQTKTAITIPKDIEIEFLESKNNGEAFNKAINIFNMFIARALFVPDLLGLSGAETSGGSHALGKEQIKVFFMHIYRRRESIEKLINYHLVRPIVLYNFGDVPNFPKFRFKPLDDGQATDLAKTWLEAVKGKVFKPNEEEINYFRQLVGFPEGDVEIIESMDASVGGVMPNEDGSCPAGSRLEPRTGKCVPTGRPISDGKQESPNIGKQSPKLGKDEDVEKKAKFKYDQVSGDYFKKVDFKAVKSKLDDYDKSLMDEAAPVLKKIKDDLLDQVQKKKIVQGQNYDRIDSIKLKNLKELKQILKGSFLQLYKDAKIQASQEILKGVNYSSPLPNDEFLSILEAETFKYIGDYEYTIIRGVKNELIAAIKDGKSLSSVLGILDDNFDALSQVSLERFARTKHTEVLNKGRKEFFDESGVVQAYQYSAIMDDRTSEICSGLHGKIFEASDAPIPPLHFNCRSLLIPITKYEEYKPTESIRGLSPDKFIEENKGDGFAVYSQIKEEKPKDIKITDPGVEYRVETVDSLTDAYVYSKDGKDFQKTKIVYADSKKDKEISVSHERL